MAEQIEKQMSPKAVIELQSEKLSERFNVSFEVLKKFEREKANHSIKHQPCKMGAS
ncbi:hypothetical protein KMZ15_04005 [Mycoavidus sp. HKI]|uniref:hypothetical protein n=1 Tax=Mycoavidus sp. HKI TaxID=2840467 RepID=UPI001CBBCDDF|nr:hypothetical protein [Mycoavidus sp. HKI]UAW64824.1 hypothetical protein KMZ15_04005 [Mycoavidus sp. HKI]